MSWNLFGYYRPNLQNNDLELLIFHNIMFLKWQLSILVEESVQWEEVPGIKVPGATEPNDRDLELIGHADNILIALFSHPPTIGKNNIKLNKYLRNGAFHEVRDIFIGTGNILTLRIFIKLIMIRIQVHSFGTSFAQGLPGVQSG